MNRLQEISIDCPYCGENITVLVDGSVEQQRYIEDCQVCCRPMVILQNVSPEGECLVEARHENDAG
jgi:transposase-like protein